MRDTELQGKRENHKEVQKKRENVPYFQISESLLLGRETII